MNRSIRFLLLSFVLSLLFIPLLNPSSTVTAATAAAPVGCVGGSPTSGALVTCYYDAPELVYSDGWKCTPPGDTTFGRCSTNIVNKRVTFTFVTANSAQPGVIIRWRPSAAQGSVRVKIDGVDRGMFWQGEESSGYMSYPLTSGQHTIELSKPARDTGRYITIHLFSNGL